MANISNSNTCGKLINLQDLVSRKPWLWWSKDAMPRLGWWLSCLPGYHFQMRYIHFQMRYYHFKMRYYHFQMRYYHFQMRNNEYNLNFLFSGAWKGVSRQIHVSDVLNVFMSCNLNWCFLQIFNILHVRGILFKEIATIIPLLSCLFC